MHIRRYQPGEETLLWDLFFNTIRTVNIRDYTQEQVETWAPDECDFIAWQTRISRMNPFVCLQEDVIIGYAGLLDSGYVDHFYVHHKWQGQGVGKLLMETIILTANDLGLQKLTSDVSITAKLFFESQGFEVVSPQVVTLHNVALRNFKMSKEVCLPPV